MRWRKENESEGMRYPTRWGWCWWFGRKREGGRAWGEGVHISGGSGLGFLIFPPNPDRHRATLIVCLVYPPPPHHVMMTRTLNGPFSRTLLFHCKMWSCFHFFLSRILFNIFANFPFVASTWWNEKDSPGSGPAVDCPTSIGYRNCTGAPMSIIAA